MKFEAFMSVSRRCDRAAAGRAVYYCPVRGMENSLVRSGDPCLTACRLSHTYPYSLLLTCICWLPFLEKHLQPRCMCLRARLISIEDVYPLSWLKKCEKKRMPVH